MKKISHKTIIKVNDSVTNSFLRRESTELTDIGLQRRTSDVIATHDDEKTQKASVNSITNAETKVTFFCVFENHYTEHEINHARLDVPCNTDTIKLQ